jgi:CubicO group peptidase (beta-lactamase class C family)
MAMIHEGKTDCKPEEIGYRPGTLDTLDSCFKSLIDKGTIQAAGYLLARHGKVFAHRTMGSRTPSKERGDFLPDSIRPIASVTKVFTATAILQLMEKGKLWLHQPVSSVIEEFDTEMHRYITIFQLLTHTSGLKTDPGNFFEPYPDNRIWKRGLTKTNWIKDVIIGPLQFKPGTVWNYSSTGFSLLAEIVARVAGMDYDRYVEKYIFEPLGMDRSFFFLPEELADSFSSVDSDYNKEIVRRKRDESIIPSLLGSGGILSTLYDLWKFSRMMLNNGSFNGARFLGRKTIEAATKAQIKNITGYIWQPHIFTDSFLFSCGLGWEVNKHCFLTEGTYDHEGAEGAGIFIDPKEDFVFIGFYPDVDYHAEAWTSPLAIAWSGIE